MRRDTVALVRPVPRRAQAPAPDPAPLPSDPAPFTPLESDPAPHAPHAPSPLASGPLPSTALHDRLADALDRHDDPHALDAVHGTEPLDERDALRTVALLHSLWMDPLTVTRGRERHQGHPVVAALKARLEGALLDQWRAHTTAPVDLDPGEVIAAMRRIAATDLVPDVYRWVADDASWDELVAFLTLEGGPDAGFDDLVALAQVGIDGIAKVALATNYWDELGRGELEFVHTELHHRLVEATAMARPDPATVPLSALERGALGGVLATNRWLQPELIGALGLLELQAGPRCRAVVRALDRLDAPPGARPFYEEHAVADPRHGKDWLDRVVGPLASERPGWGVRMVQGARWRQQVNRRFFADLATRFTARPAA